MENRDSFYTFLRYNEKCSPPKYKAVCYGQGNNFTNSVISFTKNFPNILKIVYFGDLDEEGLTIPLNAKACLYSTNPEIEFQFAEEYYNHLFAFYSEMNLKIPWKYNNPTKIDWTQIPESIRSKINELFEKAERIPQELLNAYELEE